MATSAVDVGDQIVPRTISAARPLRVCHIMSADLWAGAEVQVATTAAYLINEPAVSLSVVLLNEGPLAVELRRLGVPVTVVDETRTGPIAILLALVRHLKEHRIELVHTHRYKDTVLGMLAARLAGVPHAVRTMHGLREPMTGWAHLKFLGYETLEKAALHLWAERVIAVSQHMTSALRDAGYPAGRLTQIHNGIDISAVRATQPRDKIRQELGIDRAACVIGTVGRLSPVKGHACLLQAAHLIARRDPSVRFLIVGDGPLSGELQAMAADLQIDRACVFAGHRADVHDVMSALDVFVLPSLSEGIPMALLEAMALGTPVVATAVGGVPEIVRHRESGLLVPSGNEQALADACLELVRDRDLAHRLGAAGRGAVEKTFSHAQSGQTLVRTYRQVAASDEFVAATTSSLLSTAPPAPGFLQKVARALLARAARRVEFAAERQRMRSIRRNPAGLIRALRSARSVLVVCHGNIIRSAFAERLLRHMLGDRKEPAISSAGLYAVAGNPPHLHAVRAAHARAIDLSWHTASPISHERVTESDVIFVMDVPQVADLTQRFPYAREKTFLFTCLAPEVPLEVKDPVNGAPPMFEACFDQITRAAAAIVRALEADNPA